MDTIAKQFTICIACKLAGCGSSVSEKQKDPNSARIHMNHADKHEAAAADEDDDFHSTAARSSFIHPIFFAYGGLVHGHCSLRQKKMIMNLMQVLIYDTLRVLFYYE